MFIQFAPQLCKEYAQRDAIWTTFLCAVGHSFAHWPSEWTLTCSQSQQVHFPRPLESSRGLRSVRLHWTQKHMVTLSYTCSTSHCVKYIFPQHLLEIKNRQNFSENILKLALNYADELCVISQELTLLHPSRCPSCLSRCHRASPRSSGCCSEGRGSGTSLLS